MKNLAKYSSLEGIGTIHWFRTLVSQAKHIGEFMSNLDNCNNHPYLVSSYGIAIENIMADLIEWQETNQPLKP